MSKIFLNNYESPCLHRLIFRLEQVDTAYASAPRPACVPSQPCVAHRSFQRALAVAYSQLHTGRSMSLAFSCVASEIRSPQPWTVIKSARSRGCLDGVKTEQGGEGKGGGPAI